MTPLRSISDGSVRIRFVLDPSDWHGHTSENLWAEPVIGTDSSDLYRLMSSPFFAKGVSFQDVVRARRSDKLEYLDFLETVERSGHSNYMLIKGDDFDNFWKKLQEMGCTYEGGTINLGSGEVSFYAVDVPPAADIYEVYAVLSDGESQGAWVFQEGSVGHALKDNSNN